MANNLNEDNYFHVFKELNNKGMNFVPKNRSSSEEPIYLNLYLQFFYIFCTFVDETETNITIKDILNYIFTKWHLNNNGLLIPKDVILQCNIKLNKHTKKLVDQIIQKVIKSHNTPKNYIEKRNFELPDDFKDLIEEVKRKDEEGLNDSSNETASQEQSVSSPYSNVLNENVSEIIVMDNLKTIPGNQLNEKSQRKRAISICDSSSSSDISQQLNKDDSQLNSDENVEKELVKLNSESQQNENKTNKTTECKKLRMSSDRSIIQQSFNEISFDRSSRKNKSSSNNN